MRRNVSVALPLLIIATSCGGGDYETTFQLRNALGAPISVTEIDGNTDCCTGATIESQEVLALNVNRCMGWDGSSVNNLLGLNCQSARFSITYVYIGDDPAMSFTKNLGPTICDRYEGEIRVGNTYAFTLDGGD